MKRIILFVLSFSFAFFSLFAAACNPESQSYYTVHYLAGGGSVSAAYQTNTSNSFVLLNASRDGFDFLGWYTSNSEEANKAGEPGDSFSIEKGNIAYLYARWESQNPNFSNFFSIMQGYSIFIKDFGANISYYCRSFERDEDIGVYIGMNADELEISDEENIQTGWVEVTMNPFALEGRGLSFRKKIVVVKIETGKITEIDAKLI